MQLSNISIKNEYLYIEADAIVFDSQGTASGV
jgi:hypothetical protein